MVAFLIFSNDFSGESLESRQDATLGATRGEAVELQGSVQDLIFSNYLSLQLHEGKYVHHGNEAP